VIGMVFDAWMMHVGWERGVTTPQSVDLKLERIIDHVDHICQLAGNANHVGIGSDLDGGYGTEQCPGDVQSIADLQNLESILAKRGYTVDQIRSVFHGNFLNVLRSAWA
jgi:membrane dipeptidase